MGISEILVRFGGDLTGLSTALRGVKGMMDKAAHSIKESFADATKTLFAPLSVAGAFEAIHSLMEEVKNIKRISESTGLETGVTQDLLNLGKAAGIASEQVEKSMDKFVKGLKAGTDPEQALYNLADKMAGIEDPTERARIATAAFGNVGEKLIPILAQGSEGIKKMSEEWGKLSDAEMDEVENANRTLEKTSSKSKVLLAEWLEGLQMFHEKSKQMAWWKTVLVFPVLNAATKEAATPSEEELAHDNLIERQKVQNAKKAAEARKEAGLKAAKELADKEEYLRAAPEEKVLILTRQILALRRQMEDTTDEEERAKLGEKALDIESKKQSIQKQIAQAADEQARKQKQNAEEILKTQTQIAKLGRERNQEQMSQYMPSLQELATSGYSFFAGNRWQFQRGPFAQMAQRELHLENDAKESLIWGNKDRFKSDVSQIEEIKKSLRDAGVMSPDDKLTSIDENTAVASKRLDELLHKADSGFVVKGPDIDG